MILQKINRSLELIVKAKWKFYAPKQKDILVYDAAHNPFKKILPKKKMNHYFTRFHGDQLQEVEVNFFILFKCLINLNLSDVGDWRYKMITFNDFWLKKKKLFDSIFLPTLCVQKNKYFIVYFRFPTFI